MKHTTVLQKVLPVSVLVLVLVLLCASQAGIVSAGNGAWTSNGPAGQVITALAIDPKTPTTLYAASGKEHYGGLFKSTIGGANWTEADTGLGDDHGCTNGVFPRSAVLSLAIDPVTPTTLYAGTEDLNCGVYKSTDGGGHWSAVRTVTGFKDLNFEILSLAIDPKTPTTVYAGTELAGIFKSTDGGGHWSEIDTNLYKWSNIVKYIYALAIDPVTPTTLYAGTGGYGLYKSTDGGANWSESDTGMIINTVPADIRSLAIDPATPTTLYAGATGRGVYKSTDGGGNWTLLATPTNVWVDAVAIDPKTPSTIYAGSWVSQYGDRRPGVFKSIDGGGHWSDFSTGLTNLDVFALAIDPEIPSTLHAGTNGSGVFDIEHVGYKVYLPLIIK